MNNLKAYLFCGLFLTLLAMGSCKKVEQPSYQGFGKKIDPENVMTHEKALARFESMGMGDTLDLKFSAVINSVCSNKGCWMRLDLGGDKEAMVKFKDYGFFMPLDAKGEVIVNGKAFVNEVTIEDLKHYAQDAGKSMAEIAAITKPETTYSFLADGVLLKQ